MNWIIGMNPRALPMTQPTDTRRTRKPSLVVGGAQPQIEMVDLSGKHDTMMETNQTFTPARTWCLAALLCLIASVTIVCTTLWATSFVGMAANSRHKANESEIYNEELMKQYIAKRYPELDINNQQHLALNKNKTTHTKLETDEIHNNMDVKTKAAEHQLISGIINATKFNLDSRNRAVANSTAKLTDEMMAGVVMSVSEQEFAKYSNQVNLTEGDKKINNSLLNGLNEFFGGDSVGQPTFSDYGPDSYFYSEYDANSYYSDYADRTWTGYILEKIQELHDWITSDFRGVGHRKKSTTIPQILEALNITLLQGDISVLILKLKDLYVESAQLNLYNDSTMSSRGRDLLTNTSSATSFGLLALDILLLRNIHLLMWDNQRTAMQEVLKDSEMFAMNALFMESEKVKIIYEVLRKAQSKGRDSVSDGWSSPDQSLHSLRESLTSHFYAPSSLGHDIIDFTFSIIRAAANLGKAFRVSKFQSNRLTSSELRDLGRENYKASTKVTELDCLWTVYCRNLDKATRNTGVFGFLAKLNSIGLRIIIGEIKIQRVFDVLLQETFKGPKPLNCDGLFPRCSNKNAAKIVIESIIGIK